MGRKLRIEFDLSEDGYSWEVSPQDVPPGVLAESPPHLLGGLEDRVG